jgi:uncharacterized membrane protein
MTLAERTTGRDTLKEYRQSHYRRRPEQAQPEGGGVGTNERVVSLAAGAILAGLGLSRRGAVGMVVAALGGDLLFRGATGFSPLYKLAGISTVEDDEARGAEIAQAFTINKSPEELYQFWRNFQNLPRIMTHLERVDVTDDRHSHWVARAPRLAGGQVEWDAEIVRDDPNELIEWRSVPGSQVDTSGQIRFARGLGDRGTEVHCYMNYTPPGGRLGHFISSLVGENPKRVIREDLRNFKRLMEIGEILTIIGQPHGTCTGQGERYTESEWKPMFT